MPQFTFKIDLGHIITVLVLLATVAIAYGRFEQELKVLSENQVQLQGRQEDMIKEVRTVHNEQIRVSTQMDDFLQRRR